MISLSGYKIKEELYKDAGSRVYRAYRERNSRPVILKVLPEAHPSPERIARFKREYEIARSLDLAGVIDAYDLEINQQRWIMVLEDFGGESLTRLGIAGRLDLADFLELALAVADILGQVHRRNIIHKDINPSNIILNPATNQVKLTDFGISTVLSRENPIIRNPNALAGTLAYISPEQTGRMNRAIDYRTDFYSLGVTFYELLAGRPPFPITDAMEMVHAHLAKQPPPLSEVRPDIPPPLSKIVLKLMAKNAEDRYQSSYGLKADLTACLRQWQATGRIESFPLGRDDLSDRFQIPQKLYGREQEIETLLAVFERVSAPPETGGPGRAEMMLVSGYAGIGKSALVREIYKPITRRRGYFIAGKFDQFQRNIPYASLIQAFQSLMRQLLTESEAQITAWREKLLAALRPNGQVIIDVIPEVELIVLAVGDVSGKGVSAALLTATSLAQVEGSLALDFTPAERLVYLDQSTGTYTKPRRQNCALCYVELEKAPAAPEPLRLRAVNAGCIPPYIKRAAGQVETVNVGGFALGQDLGSEWGYEEVSLTLTRGDLIILTSDGVVEAINAAGELFGFERLEQAIAGGPIHSPEAMLAHLLTEVAAFVKQAEPYDDLTLVIARV